MLLTNSLLTSFTAFACILPTATTLPLNRLTSVYAISRTLANYPFAIDSHDFGLLTQVFTPDASFAAPPPTPALEGLDTITSFLTTGLENTQSQHTYGTQAIDFSSRTTANATTYFVGTIVGTGSKKPLGTLSTHAKYLDDVVLVKHVGWRIKTRTLVYLVRITDLNFTVPFSWCTDGADRLRMWETSVSLRADLRR